MTVDRNGINSGVVNVTIDPGSVAANTSEEDTITVPGLTTDMMVFLNKPSLEAGLGIVNVRVSAVNTLAVSFMNSTGSAIDAGSETYKLFWIKPDITSENAAQL